MSADVARDDPSGMVDRTASSNGVPIYPIEVCEATIAVNETQNPERRHLRVKGSSSYFISLLPRLHSPVFSHSSREFESYEYCYNYRSSIRGR